MRHDARVHDDEPARRELRAASDALLAATCGDDRLAARGRAPFCDWTSGQPRARIRPRMRLGRPGSVIFLASLASASLPACAPAAGEPTVAAAPSRARGEAPDLERPGAPPPKQITSDGTPPLATRLLATLPVKPRASRAGYARDQFGPPWHDINKDGCDTRDDILRRDLTDIRVAPGKRGCVVEAGVLADPYTATRMNFQRGRGSTVDIDHVVALSDAWSTGAAGWEPAVRLALANDPLNLLAVDASTNRAKGDGDAATWLPPNRAFRCPYVARQIAVKARYGLWVTADEHDAIARVLADCPDQRVPEGDATPAPVDTRPSQGSPENSPDVDARPRPGPVEPSPQKRALDPDYGSCKNAKANGAGPYRRDRDPEYHYYRDSDGDGVVCE